MFVNEVIYVEHQFLGLLDGGEWLYEEDGFHASGKIWWGNLHFTDEVIKPFEAGMIDVIQSHQYCEHLERSFAQGAVDERPLLAPGKLFHPPAPFVQGQVLRLPRSSSLFRSTTH